MVRLGVATRAETFERLERILADFDIDVVHIDATGRAIPLTDRSAVVADPVPDVGYVFPPRTMEGTVVDAVLDIPWINDRSAVLTSRNKAAVLATLARAGLPVPKTTLLSNPLSEAALIETFDGLDPPVVVKPNSTTRGAGVVKVHDLDSFLGVADYLELLHSYPPTADKTYLVQEFRPAASDYRAMVLEGTYVGAVRRHADGDRWKHNVHRGAAATGVTLRPALRTLAERAATAVDIPFVGVDILDDGTDPVITETNARPTVDSVSKYEPDFPERLAELIHRLAGG